MKHKTFVKKNCRFKIHEKHVMNSLKEFNISRQDQDAFALQSQLKAKVAIEGQLFDQEIVPVEVKARRGQVVVVSKDEHPKPETTIEGLTKLRPAFTKDNGTVTAGNASGINDGAAAVVVMSKKEAEKRGKKEFFTITF